LSIIQILGTSVATEFLCLDYDMTWLLDALECFIVLCSYAAGLFKFESREIKARMDSPFVRAVLGIGYSRAVVQRVIEQKLSVTGLYIYVIELFMCEVYFNSLNCFNL
jgi:hypothetical protein